MGKNGWGRETCLVVLDGPPAVALAIPEVWHLWHLALAAVDRDVPGEDARFEHTHLGVLASTTEEARRLDAEVANLLSSAVDERVLAVCLGSILLRLGRWRVERW